MSKQHTKLSISNRLRRGLAGILSLALLLGLLPAAVVPAEAADHWAAPYVQTLTEWGVMRGDISGNMAPERSITRAEFVTMMNRAYGYTRTAGHPFTDVRSWNWYNEDIDIAYNMGYFQGTSPTTASPNAPLTREQAAVLLARNMMLQPTVGETLGFSDSRTLSEWSRGLVGAATENGIIGGYNDGSFKPQSNITRGEVAAMLVRAIGTPIQEEGDHTLGNVYGNVTVNTPGVKLRDGVITGNLYLTGGIDLGDVLMENITVLGEIIVSGAGESNSAQSSIVLRNVTANSMSVDSIAQQFVTIRAEGNTDIKTTTVRTSAYVDDSSLPGYGLWKIIQDGGSLLQLAGNAKEVINQTPNSELQIVQGTADKVTIDEKATNSSVLVDGDARVDDLNLDVATNVTGEGDIKNLDVGAAGSTVEQLPDTVTIRPGITTGINGSTMNSTQAAEISTEPRLLAGYPKAKNIAPTTATLVFSVNKPGTIYWAVSAVADGSVSDADLIENPTYGGKIIRSGTINATAANTEYSANLTGLSQDGSYYISAILVDGRGKHSPVKVSAFSTPDGTRPAFTSGPAATLRSTKTAQVTGMPNKSCQLYWALLPEGAAAPTAEQFKANAITGNVGYGSTDVVKNVSKTVNVNRGNLKEKTNYVAYLWLTDYDGAQSSQVYRVPIYIPDETPPEVHNVRQTNNTANSVDVTFTMNETGRLYWSVVTDEMHDKKTFVDYNDIVSSPSPSTTATNAYLDFKENDDAELAAKIAVTTGTGAGAILSGTVNVNNAEAAMRAAIQRLNRDEHNTSIFYMYYVGEDAEGNMTRHIGVKEINIRDEDPPVLERQRFDTYNPTDLEHPLATTGIQLVFSESIRNGPGTSREQRFWDLYQNVKTLVDQGADETEPDLIAARDALGEALYNCIKLYQGDSVTDVASDQKPVAGETNVLNYRYAAVDREIGTGRMIISFPHEAVVRENNQTVTKNSASLSSGATYHFEVYNVHDCAAPTANPMEANSDCMTDHIVDEFRVAFAQVSLKNNGLLPGIIYNAKESSSGEGYYFQAADGVNQRYGHLTHPTGAAVSAKWKNNPPQRMDGWFTVTPVDVKAMQDDEDSRYDILIWADRDVEISVYSRPVPTADTEEARDKATWYLEGTTKIEGTGIQQTAEGGNGYVFCSFMQDVRGQTRFDPLNTIASNREYAIHVDMLHFQGADSKVSGSWYDTVHFRISVVAGTSGALSALNQGTRGNAKYNEALRDSGLSSLGIPDYAQSTQTFDPNIPPAIYDVHIENNDTNPKITVTLKDPGYVNFVLFELTTLQYMADTGVLTTIGSNQRITEQMITDEDNQYYIEKYTVSGGNVRVDTESPDLKDIPNLENPSTLTKTVDVPSASTVVGGTFPDTVQRDTTTSGSGMIPQEIPLRKPLKANTVYLLCLVPQGESGKPESRSQETYCFRFTTEAAEAPVLKLRETGSINVDAIVDRTSNVQARLLRQDNLTSEGEDNVFLEYLGDDGNIDTTIAGYTAYTGYTVMDALSTMTDGGRSVFDVYAHTDLKNRIANIVLRGTSAADKLPTQTFFDSWGPQLITVPDGDDDNYRKTSFNENQADENTLYYCVGIAYVNPNGPYSFAALPNLQLVDDAPPRVNGIGNGLTYMPGDPENPRDTGSISGTLTIIFDKYLYLSNPNGPGVLPMVALSKTTGEGITSNGTGTVVGGDGKTDFAITGARIPSPGTGVSLVEAEPPFVRTQSISFKVENHPGTSLQITIPDMYSQWSISNSAITVTLTWTNNAWNINISGGKQPWGALAPGYRP